MRRPLSRPGHPAGLRRVVTGTAAAALVAATLVPGSAAAAEESDAFLGTAEDLGVSAPDGSTKFQDDVLSGAEATHTSYFVQLKARSTLQGGSASAVEAQQQAFLADAEARGADLTVRQQYDGVWSGVSVEASKADVLLAAAAEEVVAVFPVVQIDRPEPASNEVPDMRSALEMTGADIAQSELGYTGEGTKVAIIDTGVDYNHPDLGGTGVNDQTAFPTDKVPYGVDLVGDAYNADPTSANYSPTPVPDEYPDDCNGHGTHVAGIVGADGDPQAGVRGVAPDATLGAYRVFGCEGSTESDIMLSAMEAAYDDGMDVVNMSIGSAFMTWSEYPTATAADALVDNGVVVVASIGNSGASGVYSAGAPGVGDKVIGVASYDNAEVTASAFTYGEEDTPVAYFPATGAPEPPTSGTYPLTRLGEPGSDAARACEPIETDLSGTVVLVERGGTADVETCSFHLKGVNAQNAGAEGVVLYNNAPGVINATVAGDPPVVIPYVTITQDAGLELDAAVAAGPTELTWTDEVTSAPNPTGGLISSFSSFGLTADLQLKPDLGAPGGSIYSTYPLESGEYATISGTSMAAPHVAGGVALLLQAEPELAAGEVRALLQNHADPTLWSGNPELGYREPAHRQGAGLLDIDDTIEATTSITPGKLSLGESEAGAATEVVTLTNESDTEVTYGISHVPALATAEDTNVPAYWAHAAELSAPETVTVPAGATIPVEVTITAPDPSYVGENGEVVPLPNLQYGGHLEFTPVEEGDPLRVPYAGFAGDYQSLEVLTSPEGIGVELPALGQLVEDSCDRFIGDDCVAGGSWTVFPETGDDGEPVYTMVEGDVPSVLIHFEHQARSLSLTAYEANEDGSRGDVVGEVRREDFLARSGTSTGFEVYTWNGEVPTGEGTSTPVADGMYILELSVLKALGDEDNPAHTETWASPAFTIDAAAGAPTGPETVERYQGGDRYSTAARISAEYDPGVPAAFIATGQDYPDALAGAAAAGRLGVPVLLVKENAVPGATRIELERLQPQNLVVLGGDEAISGQVESTLRQFTDGEVTRVFGENRYDTAAQIAAEYETGVDVAYVATGTDYPDALTGAARAGVLEGPVLLVKQGQVPDVTADALGTLDPQRIVVLGGELAVSDTVARALGAYAPVERDAGGSRYETAAEVAADYEPGVETVFVATGQQFPDALAGAARAGHVEAPVLLVKHDDVPSVTEAELRRLEPANIVILGGVLAISQDVEDELEALQWDD